MSKANVTYILAGGVGIEGHFLDNLIFTPATLINIDIKPRTENNKVNSNLDILFTVAILTEDEFDALQVGPTTVWSK